ncbi:MAG: AAA family ATPase [Thiomicrorhabdus sp.]|nr:AAA family ATPase [Thiomicrorhabdus sp.]
MITVIGNMKGGTGKSTVTFNLAVWLGHQGKSIRLFDLDPQQTLADVIEVRKEEAYQPALPRAENHLALETLTKGKTADEILIDVSMSDQVALKDAIKICDRILVPVAPSQADIWSTQRFMKLVKETCHDRRPEVLAVINRADTHPLVTETQESEEALDFLPGIKRIKTRLHNRTAYRRSFSEGLGVFELNPTGKASKEILKLTKHLY